MNNGTPFSNPLLAALKMPGRVFQLPSKGLLYKHGELGDCKNGEIQVKPLSAIGEIKLKSPDMLFSGLGIIEAIAECVPGIADPGALFCQDVDAILCFIRLVTYGENFTLKATHDCDGGLEHTYDVNIEDTVRDMKLYSGDATADYRVLTPQAQEVLFRPLRFREAVELMQTNELLDPDEVTAKIIQDHMVKNLLFMINSVDDITDKGMIEEWLRSVTSSVIESIARKVDASNYWGISQMKAVKCTDCGSIMNVEIPINPTTFFTN